MEAKVKSQKSKKRRMWQFLPFYFSLLTYGALCLGVSAVNLSCSSKPTDLRALAPADSLVYLETNDLGAALQPIVDSKTFNQAAKSKPDLSAIKGVQIAIAVTGFETNEKEISNESSELNFKPHFVAIADTQAWEWQARSFAENQLGEFINKIYGGGVQLDVSSKSGGTDYVWTAEDGRKAYGFVIGSLILFGNDESVIEKVQSVRRGETQSFNKNGKDLQRASGDTLIVGYVSPDGIAQISNFVGAAKAKESGEQAEVQSFVAQLLPQLLRGSIKDVTWVANKTNQGIEDKLSVSLVPEAASVLSETLAASDKGDTSLLEFAPADADAVTQYNLKNPQIAWRSILLLTQKIVDPTSGKLLVEFSKSFFEPYGVQNGEMFLGSIAPGIVTVKYGDDDVAVVAKVVNPKDRKTSLDAESMKSENADVEINEQGFENIALSGDKDVVQKCVQAHQTGQNIRTDVQIQDRLRKLPSAITIGNDHDTAALVAGVLSEKISDDVAPASRYIVETRFDKNGMERRLISDFGLVGSLIALLSNEE